MYLGRVIGTLIATRKDQNLEGHRLLIVQPLDEAHFDIYEEDTIEIEAEASDIKGNVVKVEFFANGSKIGEDTTGGDGWTMSWSDLSDGDYDLTAKATDNEGSSAISPVITISCGPSV